MKNFSRAASLSSARSLGLKVCVCVCVCVLGKGGVGGAAGTYRVRYVNYKSAIRDLPKLDLLP